MDVRLLALTAGLLMSSVAAAKIHTTTGPAPRPQPAAKKAAHNSMAKTTTPLNCQQYRWPNHPYPGVKPYCDRTKLEPCKTRPGVPGARGHPAMRYLSLHWALMRQQDKGALAWEDRRCRSSRTDGSRSLRRMAGGSAVGRSSQAVGA